MKIRTMFMTTMLATATVMGFSYDSYAAENIAIETVNTATMPISKAKTQDPRLAAASFVEHVNYARVALALKNPTLASQHITQARNMITVIKNATKEEQRLTQVESGRVIYHYDTEYKYHYFPIETGPVEVKKVDHSIWDKNDLAVTDADIVYLTLDLNDGKAEPYLKRAEDAIVAKNMKEADNELAKLTEEVVSVDEEVALPNVKAHDNIALARRFISSGNYDGATYALKHADEALDMMQKDDAYEEYEEELVTMRKDVSELQSVIAKKDPSMIDTANKKMDVWWKDLKGWPEAKK